MLKQLRAKTRGNSYLTGLGTLKFRLIDVNQSKIAASTKIRLVSRQLLSAVQHNTDVSSFSVHPFLGVEPNESWDEGEYSVVTAHTNLFKNG